jgi:hypothetical protein
MYLLLPKLKKIKAHGMVKFSTVQFFPEETSFNKASESGDIKLNM